MTDRITPERQKEFMARTLVGMVLYNKREFTDEECAVYNSILALLDQHQPAPTLMDLRGIAPDATGDLSSEEFVRRVREGWTPPNSAMPATPDMERVKQLMVLVAHWTIWVDRTKCRWDENDQKAFKEVLDILWAQRPKPAPNQRTAPEIADMITWLDNAPFLMGKLTDEEMAKAIDDAIYNAEHWDDPSQGFLRGLRNARSLLLSAPAPKTVTREWVKRTRARLDIEYIPWTEEVLISALREAGVVVEDKSEGEDD